MLTQAKKTEERQWLKEVSSVPLQQSLRHLATAYQNFFASCRGKRKGKKLRPPKFKKKSNHQSAEFTKAAFSVAGEFVYLAKIGDVKPVWSRELPSEPSSVTVVKDCADRYFLSFVVEVEPVSLGPVSPSVGIDLGLRTFAVLSTGKSFESPDYSKANRKVRKLQRKLARQDKGSNRRNKTRLRIAKQHNEIADTRKDFLHKLSTKVVSENQAITLEDLHVSGMVKNRKLARAISLQGWREFRQLCKAKSEKFGREFHVISRWEPTSQICSDCGFKWGKLDLKIRSVRCLNCGAEHDRDENAAKNINMERGSRSIKSGWGIATTLNGRRGKVRPLRWHIPMKRQESPCLQAGEYVNEVEGATTIANTIAYVSELIDPIAVFLNLQRRNLALQSLQYLLFGEGETALTVYQVLEQYWQWTPEEDLRPRLILASD